MHNQYWGSLLKVNEEILRGPSCGTLVADLNIDLEDVYHDEQLYLLYFLEISGKGDRLYQLYLSREQ